MAALSWRRLLPPLAIVGVLAASCSPGAKPVAAKTDGAIGATLTASNATIKLDKVQRDPTTTFVVVVLTITNTTGSTTSYSILPTDSLLSDSSSRTYMPSTSAITSLTPCQGTSFYDMVDPGASLTACEIFAVPVGRHTRDAPVARDTHVAMATVQRRRGADHRCRQHRRHRDWHGNRHRDRNRDGHRRTGTGTGDTGTTTVTTKAKPTG